MNIVKASNLKGKHILLVDDDPDLREAIAYDLKKKGCILYQASSGSEALGIIDQYSEIEFVISDVRMPEGSGTDMLKRLRAKNPKLPIVVLATGFADLTKEQAIELGALALLEKPINRKLLIELLEKSFEQNQLVA